MEQAPAISRLQSLLKQANETDAALSKKLPNFPCDYEHLLVRDRTYLVRLAVLFEEHGNEDFAILLAAAMLTFFESLYRRIEALAVRPQTELRVLCHGFNSRSKAMCFERTLFLSASHAMECRSKLLKSAQEISDPEAAVQFYCENIQKLPERIIETLPKLDTQSPKEFCQELCSFVSDGYKKQQKFVKTISQALIDEKMAEAMLQTAKEEMRELQTDDQMIVWISTLIVQRVHTEKVLLTEPSDQNIATMAIVMLSLALAVQKRIELLLQDPHSLEATLLSARFNNNANLAIFFEKGLLFKIIQMIEVVTMLSEPVVRDLDSKKFLEWYRECCLHCNVIILGHKEEGFPMSYGKSPEEFYKELRSFVLDKNAELQCFLKDLEVTEAQVRGR